MCCFPNYLIKQLTNTVSTNANNSKFNENKANKLGFNEVGLYLVIVQDKITSTEISRRNAKNTIMLKHMQEGHAARNKCLSPVLQHSRLRSALILLSFVFPLGGFDLLGLHLFRQYFYEETFCPG